MDLGDALLKPIKILGTGSFGRVFLCKYTNTYDVCVKRIIIQNPKIEMKMVMDEIYIISQLCHPNIVRFIRSYVHVGTVNIIMEYAPNGTLRDLIERVRHIGFSFDDILHYFCDILMGLEYLHIRHVIHRDLKPANILIAANHSLQIADFGISSVHTSNKTNINGVGTPYYLAPEIMYGEKFDYKSDIWSLGCILYELCIGHSPFLLAKNFNHLRYLINNLTQPKFNCNNIRAKCDPLWAILCEKMITFQMMQRISLPQILCLDAKLTLPYYQKYFNYKY